jgi:hypothetical protein
MSRRASILGLFHFQTILALRLVIFTGQSCECGQLPHASRLKQELVSLRFFEILFSKQDCPMGHLTIFLPDSLILKSRRENPSGKSPDGGQISSTSFCLRFCWMASLSYPLSANNFWGLSPFSSSLSTTSSMILESATFALVTSTLVMILGLGVSLSGPQVSVKSVL